MAFEPMCLEGEPRARGGVAFRPLNCRLARLGESAGTFVLADWVAAMTIVALCTSASGCDLVFYSTLFATSEGYYQSVKPRLTEQGKAVQADNHVEGCKWLGYETVKISNYRTLDAKTMAADQLTVARNSASLMGGNAVVDAGTSDDEGARYDVYVCGNA